MSAPETRDSRPRRIVVLAGGYGGAKLSHGLCLGSDARIEHGLTPFDLTIVVNTGDDLELHGLCVSPDLDTVMYTLAGLANDQTGWGLRDETWSATRMLQTYGAETWFALGDQDIATHLLRTTALRAGERLTEVTARLAAALGVAARLLPMSDDEVRTELQTDDGWLEFQEYFVHRHHEPRVTALRHRGAELARPTPELLDAVDRAELIVIAPSNPYLSVGSILAVPGILDGLLAATAPVIAISPIVGGQALRGPADRLLESLGGVASAAGVAAHYRSRYPGLVDAWVIDDLDAAHEAEIRTGGAEVLVTNTVMRTNDDRRTLAEAAVDRFLVS
jgi:LPPG:FO 2-phospho-L-lactate transferase